MIMPAIRPRVPAIRPGMLAMRPGMLAPACPRPDARILFYSGENRRDRVAPMKLPRICSSQLEDLAPAFVLRFYEDTEWAVRVSLRAQTADAPRGEMMKNNARGFGSAHGEFLGIFPT